ncbi:MAG: PD-(D/E)XK nuclease family protein [Lutibacter sp.]
MQNNHFLLDGFEWSFSRIETFSTCPYCFYLQYIQGMKGKDSFFGQYGSFIHELLEQFNKGKLFTFELLEQYEAFYNQKVTESVTDVISESYYNKGYEFFSNFEEPDYEILCSECEYKFKIGEYNFTGKIDVETINSIRDYKTKKGKAYKRKPKDNPNIKTMEDGRFIDLAEFKQLYIYCVPYFDKYGKYPEFLVLELVKENDVYIIKFDKNDFEKCKQMLLDEIQKIYETVEFIKHEDVFWCDVICGQRFNCKFENEGEI